DIAGQVDSECVIASNTSSLSVTKIGAALPNPERVVGMHFFNPVDKMPLVEIVRGRQTSDKTAAIVAALTVKLGKFPIIVEDVPGFLVNRILTPYLNEAAFLLSEGYSIADIDGAATAFGMPMGPLRLLDEVGLDVAAHVSAIMVEGYGERMKGPGYAQLLVDGGRKGKKGGAGFYEFKDSKPVPCSSIAQILRIAASPQADADRGYITKRLIYHLINEGVKCLDEGVAGNPGREAANQIDLGTVMGMGFPPFRGGLLNYASSLGAEEILKTLKEFEDAFGERYSVAEGIRKRAASKRDFYQAA
ncbi:MAG: fatty acid oxidation complex subunit alpha FadJ, partial [Deltaproteobacteria bacterium]|nr:fatty acid oxidation complex subunit alpha FadJ [Deltaproteobacteria bacterium]